jgi:hypothetical protein
MRSLYESIGDTHITVPNDWRITDNWTFRRTKLFATKDSRVPVVIGEIHDAVAGKIALVNTHLFQRTNEPEATQIIAVDSLSQSEDRYYGRAYNPNQPLEDQIALVALIALKGVDVEV